MSFGLWALIFSAVSFFAIDVNAVTIFTGSGATCRKPADEKQWRDLFMAECVASCNAGFNNKDPQKSAAHFVPNCRQEFEKFSSVGHAARTVGEIVEDAWVKCPALATGKAVGGFASLMDMALGSGRRLPPGYQGTYEDCEKDPDCKLAFARNLSAFDEMKPATKAGDLPGQWVVSDDEVKARIKDTSLNELIQTGDHQRVLARDECERDLREIRQPFLASGEDYDAKEQREVYDKIAMARPKCVALLKLYPPGFEAVAKKIGPSLLAGSGVEPAAGERPPFMDLSVFDQLALARSCLGREVAVDFCGDVLSWLVPVPLIGPQSKFLALPGRLSAKLGGAEAVIAVKEITHGRTENLAANAAAGTGDFATKTKTVAADAPISTGVVLAPEKAEARATFVNAYKDKIYATEAQNREFIAIVEDSQKHPESTQVVSYENSAMKTLNDVTGDKNLVTSLTNYHKDLLVQRINALKTKYPGLHFSLYSDFKSVQVAASGLEKSSLATREALARDLQKVLEGANRDFAKKVDELGIKKVAKAGPPETWFKGGTALGYDEANLLARYARKTGRTVEQSSREFRQKMTERLGDIDQQRQALASSPRFKNLMDPSSAAAVPKNDVFDLIRKHSDADDLAAAVRKRYGLADFTTSDARKFLDYANGVNEFSPSIAVAKREVLTLDNADQGGVSADFLGLGSENMQATAKGIAGQKDLATALKRVRQQERMVTKRFRGRVESFRKIGGKDFICSGDDCVRAAKMSFDEKVRMLDAFAQDETARQVRISFVAEGVPKAERMRLAAHGEGIEKALRKELEGQIPFAKADQGLVFGVDMQAVKSGQGTVNLIIGKEANVRLTSQEKTAIQEAFRRAVEKYNQGVLTYQRGQTATWGAGLKLRPGIGIFQIGPDSR